MITFNGVDLSPLITVMDIGGRGPLSKQNIRSSMPGRDGSYHIRSYIPERPIPVLFIMKGQSLSEIRQKVDQLNVILNVNYDAAIEFADEPDKTYFGQLDGQPSWEEIVYNGKGTLLFLCCDPCKYGQETSIDFVNDEANPNVGGIYKTFPRIEATFTAACTELTVLHTQSGKFVRVTRNFVIGDVLTIDFGTGKIMLNGIITMSILDWVNSEFFALRPGAQNIQITPIEKTSTKISWNPRWL